MPWLPVQIRPRAPLLHLPLRGHVQRRFTCVFYLLPSTFTRDNGQVVIDESSLRLLSGSQIDYTQELLESDFRVIENPRADSGCGCGVSFNLAPPKTK